MLSLARLGRSLVRNRNTNQVAYPRSDVRGRQDGTWLASAIEQAEALLADVRLYRPER